MVGKKRPVRVPQEISTDLQWEKLLQREGLVVVDIYSEWCGPCIAMIPSLKNLKHSLGTQKLHLAIAKSDSITHLKHFRNRSTPTWMFLIGGKIVNVMYGANAPKLTRLIISELKKETAIKQGQRERVEVEITDLPKDLVEEEEEPTELNNQEPETKKEDLIIICDKDFMYRPF